jgi:hypothetical protein
MDGKLRSFHLFFSAISASQPEILENSRATRCLPVNKPVSCLYVIIETEARRPIMSERTFWESIRVEGSELLDKVKQVIREGNVRRVVIKQGDRSVAEFPLTVGVVGTVLAPVLAAVGALAALLTDCSIEVERVSTEPTVVVPPESQGPGAAI